MKTLEDLQIPAINDKQALKTQFEKDGYCVAKNLYSDEELKGIEAFFEDFKDNGTDAFDGGSKYEELDPATRKVRAMFPHRHSKKVMNWFTNPKVVDILRVLFGTEPLGTQTMYYYKPPGSRGHGMHQDNFYLLASPAVCIGVWTPIEDADLENGCMSIVPGSNHYEILCPKNKTERWMGMTDSHISHFPRDRKPIAMPVKRGESLFFHGHLIHGSGPNRSADRWRRVFIGHYVDEATEQITKHCHPVVNMKGEVISNIGVVQGGGPCGDDWVGSAH
ncbi:MAG: phytanoyl-CoA dioxygenase family protein [Chthoniobacterales bacterium]